MKACCPCDELVHACLPNIPAGLPALPRQISGFPEYRLAMLRDIPLYAPLSRWRAREGDDLGIMLLEMWAYVLDILGFYDERIANETYLRTAVLEPSLRELVALIGYRPRPALAASVILAAIADGHQPVKLPPRTGFRSDAFAGQPPQIFETEKEFIIQADKNEWTVSPVRSGGLGPELLVDVETAALSVDQLVVLHIGKTLQAGRVTSLETVTRRDGGTYKKLALQSVAAVGQVSDRHDPADVLSPVKTAAVAKAIAPPIFSKAHRAEPIADLALDALYSELSEKDVIVIQRGNALQPAAVSTVASFDLEVRPKVDGIPAATLPVTHITIDPPLSSDWAADPRRLTVHFSMTITGHLTSVAKTELEVRDFALPGLPLEGVLEPIPPNVARPGELLLLDAKDNGAFANGSVDINPAGQGRVFLAANSATFDPPLRTPVTVFGNLVQATRGESVLNETLGSGDATQPFQTFKLGKHPLTYINDPAAPNGRRSTLEVRVNGILWKEVSSFFGAKPESEVYTVRHDDNGDTFVRFGDGVTGTRLPTGVDNVTATYRFGAGAAKPPAGGIGQIAKPVEGLRRVVNPVAAGGGADADQPKDIRRNAPKSALILGRAVSIPDFEALAREFGGVVNAQVEWAWDERSQNAVVKVVFISDGGDIAKELRAFLIGFADPNTPLVAIEAKAQTSKLVIDLEIDSRFNTKTVADNVTQKLIEAETGLLAKQNIPIGRALFRSQIFDAVLGVDGTQSVRVMTVDGEPAPFAIAATANGYRDFLEGIRVG